MIPIPIVMGFFTEPTKDFQENRSFDVLWWTGKWGYIFYNLSNVSKQRLTRISIRIESRETKGSRSRFRRVLSLSLILGELFWLMIIIQFCSNKKPVLVPETVTECVLNIVLSTYLTQRTFSEWAAEEMHQWRRDFQFHTRHDTKPT